MTNHKDLMERLKSLADNGDTYAAATVRDAADVIATQAEQLRIATEGLERIVRNEREWESDSIAEGQARTTLAQMKEKDQ